ncbi:MAG TPA: type II secretion system F family protein [Candidatus Saccharimonadales bacterium]|nr:type II secretion system F family protein [Candidatus Saccharimonadales bacterium]
MQFTYRAVNKDGKTVSGRAEAATRQALLSMLAKQGVHPMIVQEDRAGGKSNKGRSFFSAKPKVKIGDLVVFTRQLSTMITAGVPLAKSLAALQEDAANPYLREVLGGITKDVEGGAPLGDSFARYPDVFSEVYVNMVRAGEEGGILDDILKRLATQVEKDASIRKKVKSAMMYPMVILSVTVIAFFGIMLFIVPKLAVILTSLGGPDAELPIYTRVLLNISNFCKDNGIMEHIPVLSSVLHSLGSMGPLGFPFRALYNLPNLFFVLLLAGIALSFFLRYIRTDAGKYWFHGLLLRLPIVRTIVLKVAIARFSRTFASLMGAGVSVLDALQVTGAALGNKVIEKELKDAAEEVRNGKPLSEPLSKSKHFPPIVAQMLMVGEETGQIDTVLVKIADFYEEEVSVLIDGLAAIIEPVMIIILGAGVGLIAASVMGPIANLSKNVGT